MKVYYDADINLKKLKKRKIAIIGYGTLLMGKRRTPMS